MTATLTPDDRARSTAEPVWRVIDGHDGGPQAIRLGRAFIAAATKPGSRLARLAMLEAYERAGGDEWCLRIDVVDAAGSLLLDTQVTRGLIELERAITNAVVALAHRVDATFEIRPELTADRHTRRMRRHVTDLSPTAERTDSPGTDPASIVDLISPPPFPRSQEPCRS